MFISYQRAKAESLGFDAKGGIMERAERIIVLAFALLFPNLLIGTLWVMLVLTAITAVQRFVKVWKQASADRPVPAPPGRSAPASGPQHRRAGVAPAHAGASRGPQHLTVRVTADRWPVSAAYKAGSFLARNVPDA